MDDIVAEPITVAYVIKGFWDHIRSLDNGLAIVHESDEIEFGGEIHLMHELIGCADYIEREWHRREANGLHYDSVWDYDVSEVFGENLAIYITNHKKLPDEDWCRLKVAELASQHD